MDFDEIIARMENAEDYMDLYDAASYIVDDKLRGEVNDQLEQCEEDGDDVVEDKIIDIENSTGTILPGTGGMGTVLFTVVGVVLALLIGASFVISRRKRA